MLAAMSLRPRLGLTVVLLTACGDDAGEPTSTGATTGDAADTTGSSSGDIPIATSTEAQTDPTTTTGDDTTTGPELDILELLLAIPGMTAEEKPSEVEGYRFFNLHYLQPADHDDPDGPQFTQLMTLLHRDRGAPLVLATDGYFISPDSQRFSEPAALLHGNQLRVEHRFFSGSRPDPADWSTLTIAQAAADHHRISEALHPIYGAAWVSTGASKGGMTAMYHRRFYPDDVDATVAYVAPLSYGVQDPRYIDFLEQVGDEACRDALTALQVELLVRRAAMIGLIEQEAKADGYTYDILGTELALEVVALETPYAFWQYQDPALCATIPGPMAGDDEIWAFLDEVNAPRQQSDDWLLAYEPYYWQAAVQLGAPAIDEAALSELLMYPGADVPATFLVPGPGKDPVFDPAAMTDIAAWVAAEGENLLMIYGEYDPWTAGAFELGDATDAHRLFVAGGNHSAKILDLSADDRALAFARLEAWTGVAPSARELPPERRGRLADPP
jgi:hypothetical protein